MERIKTAAVRNLGVAALLLALSLLLQLAGGAYRCEFGGHPDEAAHYVTGLMIRDYIAAGCPGSPLRFAETYYDHYPKVALGNWPPGFYLVQTLWTLPFSPSRGSVLALMAVLTTLVATLLFHVLREKYGTLQAWIGALLFVCLPLVQRHTAMVMTEVPIALLSLAAVYFFMRYLQSQQTRDSLLFGAFASAAIMTKGSGLFLGLMPVLALIFSRQFGLLRRLNFWYPAAMVFVLCGPWTWLFRKQAKAGWMESSVSWHFTKQAISFYPRNLVLSVGYAVAAIAVIGLVVKLAAVGPRKSDDYSCAVFGGALLSLLIFHCIIPAGLEDRHLVAALPSVIFFFFAGVHWITERFPSHRFARTLVLGIALALFSFQTFFIPQKGYAGFRPVAEQLLSKAPATNEIFFVSSDAQGEGMFISEVAMLEKRPGHYVRRASKLLASSTWSGGGYEAKFKDEKALVNFLAQQKIKYAVLDKAVPWYNRRPHHDLLEKAASAFPENFILEGTFPVQRKGGWTNGISVYRLNSMGGR